MYVKINATVPVDLKLFKQMREEKKIGQAMINEALGKSSAYVSRMERADIKNIPIESVDVIQEVMKLTREERKRIFGV